MSLISVMSIPSKFIRNDLLLANISGNESFKNGTYLVSASSYSNKDYLAFNAFNGTKTNFWQSGYFNNSSVPYLRDAYLNAKPASYIGGGSDKNTWKTNVGDGKINGEWIQIQIPYRIFLDSYSILPRQDCCSKEFPSKFYLLASNDGVKWDTLDQQNLTSLPINVDTPSTYYVRTISSYTYFRLVISELFEGQKVSLCQFNLFGYLNLISGNIKLDRGIVYSTNGNVTLNNGNVQSTGGNVFSNSDKLYTSYSNITSNANVINSTQGNIMSNNSSINSTHGNIFSNNSSLTSNNSNINTNNANVTSTGGTINTNSGTFTSNNDKINSTNGVMSITSGTINSTNGNITSNSGTVNSNNGKINSSNDTIIMNGTSNSTNSIKKESFTNKNNNQQIYMQDIKPFSSFETIYNSFKITENFDEKNYKGNTFIHKDDLQKTFGINNTTYIDAIQKYELNPINNQILNHTKQVDNINKNYIDLSNNIDSYNDLKNKLSSNPEYDFDGKKLNYIDKKPTLRDGLLDDVNTMIVQENNLYILGTITLAVLLVGTIIVIRE